jgi:hypothetical protein
MIENEQKKTILTKYRRKKKEKKKPGFSTRMNKKRNILFTQTRKKMADLFSGRRFQGRHRVFVLVA